MHNHSNGNKLHILMQIKLISLSIVEHQDSLRNRDKQQLGNGPLRLRTISRINMRPGEQSSNFCAHHTADMLLHVQKMGLFRIFLAKQTGENSLTGLKDSYPSTERNKLYQSELGLSEQLRGFRKRPM